MVGFTDIENDGAKSSLTQKIATDVQTKVTKASAQVKLLGIAYLMCEDKQRFGKMIEDIDNSFWLDGWEECLKLVNESFYHICNWSNDPKKLSASFDQPMLVFHLHRQQQLSISPQVME